MAVESDEFYETLSPGIRKLVRMLNEAGFVTTDSGDGTNYREGMGCAVPYPMVVVMLPTDVNTFSEVDRLGELLKEAGVELGTEREGEEDYKMRNVQLLYSPLDKNCIVTIDNVLDTDLKN